MVDPPRASPYERRIQKVVAFLCAHLGEELSLDRLCEVAGFSKFHFHRQFTAHTGLTVAHFVRMTRLKRTAYQLAFDPRKKVIEIALEAGFSAPEAFSRAFKEAQGQSPSDFRRAPRWDAWTSQNRLPTSIRSNSMKPNIVVFEETRVAVLEHLGPPATLMSSVARFIAWRKASSDSPNATSRTFGIPYSDPRTVEPDAFRFDLCGELKAPLRANDAGVVEKIIPGGRCAVVRHVGSTDAIGDSIYPLYASWLPESGETLRDFPLYFHYIERMPIVAEHEQVTDIYFPLR